MNSIACQKKGCVLIIDDQPENIHVLANIIQEHYDVQAATNGAKALDIASGKNPPDVILLDIVMPDMDGYEVCRRLKTDEQTRDIPVIFLTAKTETADIVKGFETGAVDYVTKPFNSAELLVRVNTHLELKRTREQLEEQNQELIEAARLREDVERIVRHDLKTPLNAIISYPDIIITHENLTEESVRDLKKIEASGVRMLNMINLSLDLFKMERGFYQVQPIPVNIVRVIARIIADMQHLMQRRCLSLHVLLGGHPADDASTFSVLGEELLCYSMLANLIKNALEASPEGACVTVSLDDEEQAVIRIHNHGAVPELIQDRFFEKYVTAGKKSQGTGLGTYSARLIAETQQGRIGMTSSEHDGTTITITLPKAAQAPAVPRSQTARPHADEAELQAIMPPSQDTLAMLYDSAGIGDIAALQEQLTEIETLDHTYAPFAAALRQLVNEFQMEAMQIFIKRYMNVEPLAGGSG